MKNQHTPRLFLISFFFILLVIPLVSQPALPDSFWQPFRAPSFGVSFRNLFKNLINFPPSFSEFFNSHYFLRDHQVSAFEGFRLRALGEKEFPNVLIGKEDWLYYTGEDNIRDFECTSPFTGKELSALIDRLKSWDDRLDGMGIDFYVLIAPNKEVIYPQYLPDDIRPHWGVCRIDQVMAGVADTKLKVLYPASSLVAGSDISQDYHRTDTHWNDTGALIAAGELLESISRDYSQVTVPTADQYIAKERPFSGDLARFIPQDPRFVEQAVFLTPAVGFKAKITQGQGRSVESRTGNDSLPSALVFRDSFSDALIPFMAEYFSTAEYVHSFSVDFDLVDQQKPDLVILEIAQRYLGVLH